MATEFRDEGLEKIRDELAAYWAKKFPESTCFCKVRNLIGLPDVIFTGVLAKDESEEVSGYFSNDPLKFSVAATKTGDDTYDLKYYQASYYGTPTEAQKYNVYSSYKISTRGGKNLSGAKVVDNIKKSIDKVHARLVEALTDGSLTVHDGKKLDIASKIK